MTKKHFIAIAAMFKARLEAERKAARPLKDEQSAGVLAVENCIAEFSAIAGRDNPQFDARRFLTACGM